MGPAAREDVASGRDYIKTVHPMRRLIPFVMRGRNESVVYFDTAIDAEKLIAYHHLYEWGNCPLFMMVGQIEERPVVRAGEVVVRPILPIRFSYDERIDDGLTARHGIDATVRILENPFEELGCLKEDGSDARPLDGTAEPIAEH